MSYKQDIQYISNLDLPWEKLNGCNILITGASGLIGSCLVESLVSNHNKAYHIFASGRSVKRLRDRFKNYINDPYLHFLEYDVTEPLNSSISFHYIIHAASNASPNSFRLSPVEIMKSNIFGVSNLLDYGKINGLIRFLFISSGEVYGEGDGSVFTEDYSGYVDCTNPRSCYPSSKRAAETLTISYSDEYNLDVVIARPCHIIGPYFSESDNRVFAQFIRNVLAGEDIVLKSTGQQLRSWCYVVDCISALLYILLKGENRQAYNISDPSSNFTIRELAEMIAYQNNRKVVFSTPSDSEKKGFNPVTQSLFSVEKLQKLGWSINGNLSDKIQTCIKEYQL